MIKYIKAENLKCKRTFAKRLVVIAPLFMVFLAFISGKYFVQNGYNWWYSIILPGFITLTAALVDQLEEKKLHCRAVFSLPLTPEKIWTAKVMVIAIYVAAASLIHFAGILIGKYVYNSASSIPATAILAATAILIVVSLFQIPLCLFLAQKFGLMATIFLNIGGGIVLTILTDEKAFWWICPYAFASRLMCPILGILPNGTLAPAGDTLLNPNVIPLGLGLSVVWFALLTVVTGIWFSKQEVK